MYYIFIRFNITYNSESERWVKGFLGARLENGADLKEIYPSKRGQIVVNKNKNSNLLNVTSTNITLLSKTS